VTGLLRRIPQMPLLPRAAAGLNLALALAYVGPGWAQAPRPAAIAQAVAAQPQPAASAPPAAVKSQPHVVVIEDDGARIEEVRDPRAGGTARRITVQSKVGNVRAYEIQVAPPGRDPSQERGNAGQRTWSLFNF